MASTADPRALWLLAPPSALRRALAAELQTSGPVDGLDPDDLPPSPPAGVPVLLPSRCDPDLRRCEAVADWVAGGGAPRLVLVSSAQVHEPSHRHVGYLAEAALRTRRPENAVARRWLLLEERLAAALDGRRTRLDILRPTALPLAGGDDPWSRLVAGRWAAVPAGFDPSIQWLEVGQLARAIRRLAADAGDGSDRVFHVAPPGVEPLRSALRRRGVRAVPLPSPLLRLLYRLSGRPPAEVDYLRHPWTVSGAALGRLESRAGGVDEPPRRSPRDRGHDHDHDHGHGHGHDPYGMDRGSIDRLGRTLFAFLHDRYWRIEWRGLEHVPRAGAAVLVGVHRGHQPWDGVMVLHRLARSLGRYPRFLIHPTLVRHPFLAPYMIRCGGLPACRASGDWTLSRGELLGIFPEGIRGAFARYRDAYRLRRFGRHDFVKFALRHRVPIVPFVILGTAEIFPILGEIHWRWWKRVSGWPFLPITPTLSLVPLPSKWHGLFLEPVPVHERYGPEAADDPRVVKAVSDDIKARMDQALQELRARRRHLFHGSIFEGPDWRAPRPTGSTTPRGA